MTTNSTDRTARWTAGALLLVLVVALAMRYGTNVLERGSTFDERFIRVPIENLLNDGWSVRTAIDFQETKGPTLIWMYAIWGEVLGGDLNDLRLLSVILFVIGAVPLVMICRHCGMSGPGSLLVACFYVLLPHHAALGQLLMSEPSFVCGSLWAIWAFVWGFGESRESERRIAGPIIFGVILSILLHERIHAVALGGAAILVSYERDGWRSWPWWLACATAGLSRIPLWIRWGGLVSPNLQSMHGLGFSLDCLTYLAAAFVPYLALLVWPVLTDPRHRPRRWLIWLGAGIGLGFGVLANPSLVETLPYQDGSIRRFQGLVSTGLRTVTASPALQPMMMAAMAAVGTASIGALAAISWDRPLPDRRAVVWRFQLWTLVTGWGLYALTRSVVFDRYVLAWLILLPIIWVVALPRKMLLLQALGLVCVFGWYTWKWLVQ